MEAAVVVVGAMVLEDKGVLDEVVEVCDCRCNKASASRRSFNVPQCSWLIGLEIVERAVEGRWWPSPLRLVTTSSA